MTLQQWIFLVIVLEKVAYGIGLYLIVRLKEENYKLEAKKKQLLWDLYLLKSKQVN